MSMREQNEVGDLRTYGVKTRIYACGAAITEGKDYQTIDVSGYIQSGNVPGDNILREPSSSGGQIIPGDNASPGGQEPDNQTPGGNNNQQPPAPGQPGQGFFKKTINWAKEHPGGTALILATATGLTIWGVKASKKNKGKKSKKS